MNKFFLGAISILCVTNSFAKGASDIKRIPAATELTIWETREIPVGKACPYQALRYDEIAYLSNAKGGYVCFRCDYTAQSPLLVVTEETICSSTLKCNKGKCQ